MFGAKKIAYPMFRSPLKLLICHHPSCFSQPHVHGNARSPEDLQPNHHQHHAGRVPRRPQDARGVPQAGPRAPLKALGRVGHDASSRCVGGQRLFINHDTQKKREKKSRRLAIKRGRPERDAKAGAGRNRPMRRCRVRRVDPGPAECRPRQRPQL